MIRRLFVLSEQSNPKIPWGTSQPQLAELIVAILDNARDPTRKAAAQFTRVPEAVLLRIHTYF